MFSNIIKALRKYAGCKQKQDVYGQKKWQVTYIAPLQPSTLAAFLPWGDSIGAGRIRLAGAKVGECS